MLEPMSLGLIGALRVEDLGLSTVVHGRSHWSP